MLTQTKLDRMNVQYKKLKDDAKNLMLRGDLKRYFKKLVQITEFEKSYREMLVGAGTELRAAA